MESLDQSTCTTLELLIHIDKTMKRKKPKWTKREEHIFKGWAEQPCVVYLMNKKFSTTEE